MNEVQLRFYSFRKKGLVKSLTLLTFISIDICYKIPLQHVFGVIGGRKRFVAVAELAEDR